MKLYIVNGENKELPGKFKAPIPLFKELPSTVVNGKDNPKIKLKLRKNPA